MDLIASSASYGCVQIMSGIKIELQYSVKMLLLAVVTPVCLVWLGCLAMSVVEPKPELGGYGCEWSHVIRAIVFVLSVCLAILCSALHRHEQLRGQGAQRPAFKQILPVALILLIIPYATLLAGNMFIREH